VLGVLNVNVENEGVSALAEATLVVVLFTDASRMDLRSVLREHTSYASGDLVVVGGVGRRALSLDEAVALIREAPTPPAARSAVRGQLCVVTCSMPRPSARAVLTNPT
jgi:hypothetical protein